MNGGKVGGLAGEYGVLLNLREIRAVAIQHGMDSESVLGAVLIHESLGHQMDRLDNGGVTGNFMNHFNYSKTKKPGNLAKEVHEHITAIDEEHADSHPVREYGAVNAAEDFATSVDSMVTRALGSAATLRRSERLASQPDSYREELAMELFEKVARSSKDKTGKGHGFIGSPVSYMDTPDGVRLVPGRQLEYTNIDASRFISEEVDNYIASQGLPKYYQFVDFEW